MIEVPLSRWLIDILTKCLCQYYANNGTAISVFACDGCLNGVTVYMLLKILTKVLNVL